MRSGTDRDPCRRPTWRRVAIASAFAAAVVTAPRAARAEGEGPPPPTYGRIDGDVAFVVGAGAVVAARGVRVEGELRVRYLDSAGAFVTYEDAPLVRSPAEPRRVVVAGLELRPLFFFRWLRGYETDEARFDLWVDSFGIELGALWLQPDGEGFGARAGVQLGLGLEFPVTAGATGVWIGVRGGLRWSDDALAYGAVRNADDREAYLALTLAWHQLVSTHAVDMGDEAPR
jgi:hypothetical protein